MTPTQHELRDADTSANTVPIPADLTGAALRRWDIACMVIDNFGDAGVAWRLARQLAVYRGYTVRLFIDDLHLLHRLVTGRPPEPADQPLTAWQPPLEHGSVQVLHLDALNRLGSDPQVPFGDVIVETFACGLPQVVMQHMAQARHDGLPVPLWVNLEYLSAESWVEGCHGLHAAYMQGALSMGWFFPGFGERTGGLLREPEVAAWAQCDRQPAANQLAAEGRDDPASERRLAVLGAAARKTDPQQILTYLFCYDRPEIKALLQAMRQSQRRWKVLVPPGIAERCLRELAVGRGAGFGWSLPAEGLSVGSLDLVPVPFVPQPQFDDALAGCDLILIRGEDSFVRAQWAAAPMLWHIYPQLDDAHQPKLSAFWGKWIGDALSDPARQALLTLSGLLNAPAAPSWPTLDLSTPESALSEDLAQDQRVHDAWAQSLDAFAAVLPELSERARQWRTQLLSEPDLLTRLEHWLALQPR